MQQAVIGTLRGVLSLDSSSWDAGIRRSRGDLASLGSAFEAIGRTLDQFAAQTRNIGIGLSVGLTAPLAALGVAAVKGASTFESAMKRVEGALGGATAKQVKALADQARQLGPQFGKGASEAADGINDLARAGMSAQDILGGGLAASLQLAAAGASELAPATSLVSDVMGQFKVTTAQLPTVVQNVVGSLDASKFAFGDFSDAVSQGGGVAAAAGLSFADFAAAIAATSSQFSSGSDAGTSFKTYMQSLVPVSDDAARAMKTLGIEFFDQNGRMKPLAEQADILNKALGNLSDKSKTEALKTMFGADAARTAIGLMEQGRAGIENLQRTIAGGDVAGKIAKQKEGEAAASKRIAVAFESVKIAIGETGLLDAVTAVKNAFAGMLESIAGASPTLLKVGVAVGAVVAALGPLALALGAVGSIIIAKVAAGFGILGRALAFIINPVAAFVSEISALVARFGLLRVIGHVGAMLLRLAGPVGIAVSAFLLLKDSIIPVLQGLWKTAQETLGPPFTALMQSLQNAFAAISGGPIGAALAFLGNALGVVMDVIGTFVALVVDAVGRDIIAAFNIALVVIKGFVDYFTGFVNVISSLITGDFNGAFEAAGGMVETVVQTIISVLDLLVPGIAKPLQDAYAAAKAWLADGFASIAESFTATVDWAVSAVSSAFPGVVSAAQSVYTGVKTWLVDKFGWIMEWVGKAAAWIGDKYAALKERLGLGSSPAANDNSLPAPPKEKPAPPPAGNRNVNFAKPEKAKGAGRKAKGPSPEEQAERREALRLQAELEAARERGDHALVQRLRDRMDLQQQINAYEQTGLSKAQARAAAERDLKDIWAARAEAVARELSDEQRVVALEAARIAGNTDLERSLARQEELRRRIEFYATRTKDAAEAEKLALADQVKIDEARAQARQRWLDDDARRRERDLAEMRGASDEELRRLDREEEVRARARVLATDGGMSEDEARRQAEREALENDRARVVGSFRTGLSDAFRAAMDGNLKGFVKDWFKERIAKGMEDAFDSIARLFERLLGGIPVGGTSGVGIGGGLGSIFGAIGGLFGGRPSALSLFPGSNVPLTAGMSSAIPNLQIDVPGFAQGGSFKVGGMSGVDANLVAMRLTKGEMVDIRPANDTAAGGRWVIEPSPWFDVRAADAAEPSINAMGTRAAAGGSEMAQRRMARQRRQRLGYS